MVLRGNKMREGENNTWRGKSRFTRRKNTQANGENRRLRGETKGADNAKKQHKFMREDDGENYRVQLVLRKIIKKHEGE